MKKNVYIKENVDRHEYSMHTYVYNLDLVNVPKIINWDPDTEQMQIEKIPNLDLSNYYGEEFNQVPKPVTDNVRQIIQLLKSKNIIYPDITGYNFIEYNNQVWIIDFEHSYFDFGDGTTKPNKFVEKFINGTVNDWNPDFR